MPQEYLFSKEYLISALYCMVKLGTTYGLGPAIYYY